MKILFLDIDGPLIPSYQFLIDKNCSLERNFAQGPLACLKKLLELIPELCIVANSSHNYHETKKQTVSYVKHKSSLKNDLILAGIDENRFHQNWRTLYPHAPIDNTFDLARMRAINHWIKENGDCEWICFDDEQFTDNERLIKIDFDVGITLKEVDKACKLMNVNQNRIII